MHGSFSAAATTGAAAMVVAEWGARAIGGGPGVALLVVAYLRYFVLCEPLNTAYATNTFRRRALIKRGLSRPGVESCVLMSLIGVAVLLVSSCILIGAEGQGY